LTTESIHRYELPAARFEPVPGETEDWMFVSHSAVEPIGRETFTDIPGALASMNVELRVMESLDPLRSVWHSSLHASGIRLRNAQGWPA
jgi:hypothetical protein